MLQVMARALNSCDNCYTIPDFRVTGRMCKTNMSSSTAFRGFGAPQGVMAIENVMTDIATFLHMSPHMVSRNIVTIRLTIT